MDLSTPLDNLTDQQLVMLYRSGREEAFGHLMKRFERELFHFLIRFVGNRSAAEDIFQEAFLQVHVSIQSFDLERAFKPWLFTIAANKARDYLRRTSQRPLARLMAPIDGQDDGMPFLDLLEAQLPAPDALADQQETRQRVREVIDRLPAHLREILLLAYFHQFPYKDIARMLEIPLGTVKSRLHAAVGTFAQEWKQGFESD